MLNFLNHFVVPDVPYVMIYHDDTDPNLYYMVPEQPSLLRRSDGSPALTLISFARDFTLLADAASELPVGETEGGLLTLTGALEVSQEDQTKIRNYIQAGAGRWTLKPYFTSRGIHFSPMRPSRRIKLSYPTWVDGSVNFGFLSDAGETYIKARQGSEKPSLVSNNLATYEAVLGQEGMRLIRQSLEDGYSPGSLNYSVSFVARIPSLTVSVTGKAEDVYEEIKKHSTIVETYRRGNRVRRYQYPQVSSLEEMQDLFTELTITYDKGDFRTGDEQADTSAIQELVFNMVNQLVTQRFLSSGFEPGLVAEKLGTDPLAHGGGERMPGGNQLWLKNFNQSMESEINFKFEGSTNFTVQRYPTSQLYELVDAEDFKNSIVEADLSQPYFSLLDVPVQVTADFDRDPIAAIKVFLDYDQLDERVTPPQRKRRTEEFLFDSTEDRHFFRTIMARNADGTPKDEYSYRSQIIYKASARSVQLPTTATRDRNLVIGYDQLNCVNVTAYWGAIPVDAVQQVQVAFRYPGLDSPTAAVDILLRPDVPSGNWFTYTEDSTSSEYEYEVTFHMADGQVMTMPRERSSSSSLIINAPFQDKLSATFIPQGTFPPISAMAVTTEYVDGDYDVRDVHTFAHPSELWEWEVELRDRTKRDFRYRYDITYTDSSSSSSEWIAGSEGTILVGDVAREMLEVEVVPDLIDMSQWRLVLVRLSYDDPASGVDADHTIKLTAIPPRPEDLLWVVPIKDASKRSFTYRIQAFGHSGERHIVEPTITDDPLLLLEF